MPTKTTQDTGLPARVKADDVERTRSTLYFVWRGVRNDPYALAGALLILMFVICALFAPFVAPFDPNEAIPELRLQGIGTPGHILGLDAQGRDMLSRLIYGSRYSLVAGVTPVILGTLLSIPLGMIAAYYERLGYFIMRFMDILGIENLIVALVVVLIPYNTRVVYVQALAQKELGYIEAARASATSDAKILFVEMLPHVVSASVVYSMTIVGTIVVTAAGLSFLGLGVQPPTPEWGIMTSDGRTVLHIAPHVSTLPGIAIFLMVTGFNLLGDSLRDSLDPRTRLTRAATTKADA
jgi:peptide/nickel transport system permease protein